MAVAGPRLDLDEPAVSPRDASQGFGTAVAIVGRMELGTCPSCDGLVPAAARACPHCDEARPAARSWIRRLAGVAVGGVAAMTLMACYGGPAYWDDCVDQDGDGWFPTCYDEPCDPELDPNCDCDDNAATIHPGAPDSSGDGVDQDCSGADGPGKRRVDAGVDPPDAAIDGATAEP